ncbi:LysR family transcriptional regulator [Chitinimonas sp. PSY-7]|uniref:LysR substrate-binding domain-containing protein n=1 Tax=Chitinimonas sp. PSY-7 TaxID=3459088 RepID=UPI0040400C46
MENNRILPDELAAMAIFATVVEAGSLTLAAERLELSKSAVSKSLAWLEGKLAARLLQRTTRRQSLTEVGQAYFEHCRRMLAEAAEARQAVDRLHAEPVGVLRVSAPVSFGSQHVAPLLPELLARYPALQIDLVLNDHLVDLAEEGFDLAVRVSDQPADLLVARTLAPIRWVICASPTYLARYGTPERPQDLSVHACLTYPLLTPSGVWPFMHDGQRIVMPVQGPLRTNSSVALMAACVGGAGLTRLPTFSCGNLLASGELVAVLQDYAVPPQTATAVYLPNRYQSPKLRAFIDFMRERMGAGQTTPSWDAWLTAK